MVSAVFFILISASFWVYLEMQRNKNSDD